MRPIKYAKVDTILTIGVMVGWLFTAVLFVFALLAFFGGVTPSSPKAVEPNYAQIERDAYWEAFEHMNTLTPNLAQADKEEFARTQARAAREQARREGGGT